MATVDDIDAGQKSDPSGTVSFSSSNATGGVFGSLGASCTLVPDLNPLTFTSSCTVAYTGDTAQTDTISATYDEASSPLHASSSGTDTIVVTTRDTQTTLTCVPSTVAINQGTVCTAVVDDIDGGTKSSPPG